MLPLLFSLPEPLTATAITEDHLSTKSMVTGTELREIVMEFGETKIPFGAIRTGSLEVATASLHPRILSGDITMESEAIKTESKDHGTKSEAIKMPSEET